MLDRWPRSEEMRVGCPLSRSYARYATLCESGRQRTDRRPRSVLRIRDKVDRAENARGEVKSKLLRTNAGDSTRERAERRDERLDRLGRVDPVLLGINVDSNSRTPRRHLCIPFLYKMGSTPLGSSFIHFSNASLCTAQGTGLVCVGRSDERGFRSVGAAKSAVRRRKGAARAQVTRRKRRLRGNCLAPVPKSRGSVKNLPCGSMAGFWAVGKIVFHQSRGVAHLR